MIKIVWLFLKTSELSNSVTYNLKQRDKDTYNHKKLPNHILLKWGKLIFKIMIKIFGFTILSSNGGDWDVSLDMVIKAKDTGS